MYEVMQESDLAVAPGIPSADAWAEIAKKMEDEKIAARVHAQAEAFRTKWKPKPEPTLPPWMMWTGVAVALAGVATAGVLIARKR